MANMLSPVDGERCSRQDSLITLREETFPVDFASWIQGRHNAQYPFCCFLVLQFDESILLRFRR